MLTGENEKLVSGRLLNDQSTVDLLLALWRRRWDASPPDWVNLSPQSLQEYSFSPVWVNVSGHRARLVELHSAHRTFVRLHSTVYQLMPLQLVLQSKLFAKSVAS